MDECGEKKHYKPFMGKAGNPEFRRRGHPVCERCPHDMTMMLETIRGAGARPERISPARWISLLRGRPTVLPGCESPLVMVRVPSGYTVRCLFPAGEKGHSFQAEMQ